MAVITRGEREVSDRFETFPAWARERLEGRIRKIVDTLQARSEAAAPLGKTGKLRSEVRKRVFADQPTRIAGYVDIFAGSDAAQYPKAATLEYGTNRPRKIFERAANGALVLGHRGRKTFRIVRRLTKPVHIRAFRYLRQPLQDMRAEIEAQLDEAIKPDDGGTP
jgi:hypothetical protein